MTTQGIVDSASIHSTVVTSGIVDAAFISSPGQTTKGIVDRAVLSSNGSATLGIVDAAFIRKGGNTKGIISSAYIINTIIEPFVTVTLPSGTWTQTVGPTITPPSFEMPPGSSPGLPGTITLHNDKGDTITLNSFLHTRWGHSSTGYYAIRERPFLPFLDKYKDIYSDVYGR